jgi:hypothetical protein
MESLEVRIVEKLIEVFEAPFEEMNELNTELINLVAKYRSRITYLNKKYKQEQLDVAQSP